MQYHCLSLANNNYHVTVIANSGDKSCDELESNPNIQQKLMVSVPELTHPYIPSILNYLVKPIWQAILLAWYLSLTLFSLPHVVIVQNPPSIPTLPVLVFYSKITRSKLIIDWHNYGYSILALKLKPSHKLVKISKWLEFSCGQYADAGFCVSESMRKDLIENHKLKCPIQVLYDRPPSHFKPLTLEMKRQFFTEIKQTIPTFSTILSSQWPNRPAILITSTSWTEDEDFELLLEALKLYDQRLSDDSLARLPDILCVVTGKGPLKPMYEKKIGETKFQHTNVILPWLTSKDYPKMVASADLGISLHCSSSGLDLPMKIVDMFGCCVPVLAYHYPAINELVKEDFYGLTFTDSSDLCSKIELMLKDFHNDDLALSRYRKNITLIPRWEYNWDREAGPLVDRLCQKAVVTL